MCIRDSNKNNNADISQPGQISKSSPKIVRFPKFIYIIGLLHLASKRVLSGSDCLKIDGGWGAGGAYSAPRPLAVLRGRICIAQVCRMVSEALDGQYVLYS